MIDISIQRIVLTQMALALVVAGATLGLGWLVAGSTLLGGLSVALPSAYMAWRLRKLTAIPEVALAQMVRAEVGKWLMTGVIIGAVFLWVESLSVGFFFLGLVATYVFGLVAILLPAFKVERKAKRLN